MVIIYENKWADCNETCYIAVGTQADYSLMKLCLWPILCQSKIWSLRFLYEKKVNIFYLLKTTAPYDLRVGRYKS